MKIEVVHAGPISSPKGLIHMSNTYDDVEKWERTDNLLTLTLHGGKLVVFNWDHILRMNVDPFGSVRV